VFVFAVSIRRLLYSLIGLGLLFTFGPRWDATGAEGWFATAEGRPLIFAHGGAKDMFPENTMVAFTGAAAIGIDVLEIDASLTADGVLIAAHGPNLESTTNGSGPIRAATFAEIQQLDAAARFQDPAGNNPYRGQDVTHPPLQEVLEQFRGTNLRFLVELKDAGPDAEEAATALARILTDLNLEDRVIVASFATETLVAFRTASNGRVSTSGSEEELRRIIIPGIFGVDSWWLVPGPVAALQIPIERSGFDLSRRAIIRRAHQHAQAVHYWTIDDPELMRTLTERGADGIITDRPDLARQVFTEMGFTLPPPVAPAP
jgi:glycerophosphoryl diester phosphodiesterase